MGTSIADILARFNLVIKPRPTSACSCAELKIDPKFYRISNLQLTKWNFSAALPDSTCSLCRAIVWMFQNTPGCVDMGNASATGINLLFQSRPRLDRLTFCFVDNKAYPPIKHCPYSLVPLCEGSQARLGSSVFDPELVLGWLSECDSSHACVDKPRTRDSQFELRVIDVEDICVVAAPAACKYAAISYVWGKVTQPLLQMDNSKRLAIKKSLSSLQVPQTIEDAMLVCRLLKIRYLWVDSLCIVQDSNDHAAGQIAHMHHIYREAYLTLVVAAGSDCASGIPSIQPRPAPPPVAIIDQVKFAIVPHSFDAIEYRVQTSTWNQRCWTMQESALSRRRLVFTSHEYFLSCDKGLFVEALSGKVLQQLRSSVPPLPKHIPGKLPTAADGRSADSFYPRIVSLYVKRRLTYPEDILRAFEGMSSALSSFLGPFRWGHPHRLFRHAMCWSNHARLRRRDGFPSWSWSGWHHPHNERRAPIPTIAFSTWPFHFPSFGVLDMWPHCSVYFWQTLQTLEKFDHIYEFYEQKWPVRMCPSGPSGACIGDFLQWLDDEASTDLLSTSSCFRKVFSPQFSTIPSMATMDIGHFITFRSAHATFSNSWFPPAAGFQTHRAYVTDLDLLEPRLCSGYFHARHPDGTEHQVAAHEEVGNDKEPPVLTLIFVGQLKDHVVVLPIHVDAKLPADGQEDKNIEHVVARRLGNPFRLFNNVWYKHATKCVVHLR